MAGVLLAFLCALALALLTTPAAAWAARRLGILDLPAPRKLHRVPTPLLGGAAVYLAFSSATLLWARPVNDLHVILLLAGAAAFALIGIVDDVRGVGAAKLAVEAGVVVLIVWLGDFRLGLPWPYAGYLVAAGWIVGLANALNCLDCADGTASGAAAVSAGALALLAILAQRWAVATTAAALAGASLGFLRYNFPPARIFLGDSGSLMLGFLLAALSAALALSLDSAWEIAALGVILGLPAWDFLLVHWRRYRNGLRNPIQIMVSTGKDHLPHRLLESGLRPGEVVMRICGLSAVLGASGIGMALWGVVGTAISAGILSGGVVFLNLVRTERVGRNGSRQAREERPDASLRGARGI
ncbi:MAG: undecaprenyl/decaprenyl-phosphate alpha-N-acetylglucosaminyl 1-phosphate transferase [Armatimonadetes bacterium]|nr:undecaprenyl/decaprenyl-phosphate alpha-N-acetylglucosaminyl 1-phosphate transferase [Armatimonadota bacterium]MDW8153928.1 MraY family glycosyltransferase [Armatimonadota bacterium]